MTREETIDKILNELLDDFIKAKLPLMKGMTLFAKVQNAVHYVANLSAEPCDVSKIEQEISRLKHKDTSVEGYRWWNNAIENCLHIIHNPLCAEPCEDYISRQAVLDVLMPYCADDDGSVENTDDLRNALDDIESLPPVIVRPKGKWMKSYSWSEGFGMGESYGYYYECSQCGKSVKSGFSECGQNFCPNCGAKMEREETV